MRVEQLLPARQDLDGRAGFVGRGERRRGLDELQRELAPPGGEAMQRRLHVEPPKVGQSFGALPFEDLERGELKEPVGDVVGEARGHKRRRDGPSVDEPPDLTQGTEPKSTPQAGGLKGDEAQADVGVPELHLSLGEQQANVGGEDAEVLRTREDVLDPLEVRGP